jgi:hypothetical protein
MTGPSAVAAKSEARSFPWLMRATCASIVSGEPENMPGWL